MYAQVRRRTPHRHTAHGIGNTTIYVLCCRRQQEDARAAETLDIWQAHHAEMQQQAAAHAALCRDLHAQAEADAEAAAQLAADAAASQQVMHGHGLLTPCPTEWSLGATMSPHMMLMCIELVSCQ